MTHLLCVVEHGVLAVADKYGLCQKSVAFEAMMCAALRHDYTISPYV